MTKAHERGAAIAALINAAQPGTLGQVCDALLVLGVHPDETAELMDIDADEIPSGDNE